MDALLRDRIPRRHRRYQSLFSFAHDLSHADRDLGVMVREGQNQRIPVFHADFGNRYAWRFRRAGSFSFLRVLGSDAGAHVFSDRRLGRRTRGSMPRSNS